MSAYIVYEIFCVCMRCSLGDVVCYSICIWDLLHVTSHSSLQGQILLLHIKTYCLITYYHRVFDVCNVSDTTTTQVYKYWTKEMQDGYDFLLKFEDFYLIKKRMKISQPNWTSRQTQNTNLKVTAPTFFSLGLKK